MQFVRVRFGSDVHRNGSIVKQLVKKHGARQVNAMVQGAALLGWQDLRSLNSVEGIGRQWAQAAYWQHQNHGDWHPPEALRAIFKRLGT